MILLKNFWVFACWLLIILYLSFTPLTNWPQPTIFQKLYMDKVVHIFMYGLLSFFLLRSIWRHYTGRGFPMTLAIAAVVFCASVGVAIEFLQPVLTMYRRFEFMDMVANATGSVAGLIIFRWVYFGKQRGSRSRSAVK